MERGRAGGGGLRPLGGTGLQVSRLGIGLAAVGRPAYINLGHGEDLGPDRDVPAVERRAHAVLDAAWEGGIRYIDAARSYGRAEAFLASWLAARGLAPGEVAVGSKWGYAYVGDWRLDVDTHEVKDLSADQLRRQLGETLELLGAHLGLYQIHSATVESGVLTDEAVRSQLAALRERGVAIGLTTTGPRQADTIRAALDAGGFDCVQATWNLLDPSAGPALAEAHDAGLGVIVKEAVANGRLTDRGDAEALKAAARERGVGTDALALAAVLAQPWADVVLSGAGTPEQVRANLAALEVEWTGEPGELAEAPEAYWERRSALAWT